MSPLAKLFRWGTFAYEAFLAIPVLGGAFVVSYAWAPLGVAFLLHLAAAIILFREGRSFAGNLIGVVISFIAIIPFIGWILHVITAVVLLIEGLFDRLRDSRY